MSRATKTASQVVIAIKTTLLALEQHKPGAINGSLRNSMNAALLFALLLMGGPLVAFLVIISLCLPGIVLARWHQRDARIPLP